MSLFGRKSPDPGPDDALSPADGASDAAPIPPPGAPSPAPPPPPGGAAPSLPEAEPDSYTTPPYLTPFPEELDRIALVAGGGRFPFLLAQAARAKGVAITAFGINGITDPALAQQVDAMEWLELGQFGRLIDRLGELDLRRLAMVGRVKHTSIFQYRHFDKRAMKLIASAATWRADSLLGAVCRDLAKEGIEVLDSTLFMRSLMPKPGMITRGRELTAAEWDDVAFGFPLARAVAGLDIGQSIVVKGKMVLAVEAAEGTDGCLERAAALGGDGIVLVKVSKPGQDLRFDVPVIGLDTIRLMTALRGAVIAVSGGESLIFDRDEVVRLADEAGIAIVAIDHDNPPRPVPVPPPTPPPTPPPIRPATDASGDPAAHDATPPLTDDKG